MGSAVSSVISPIAGIAGGAVGSLTSAMTPKIQVADQAKLNEQIASTQNQQAGAQQTAAANQGQYTGQLGAAQNALAGAGQTLQGAAAMNAGGDVQNALALLQGQAVGTAPSAAQAQLQAGTDQAIKSQMAMANSGNLSQMLGGQKTAMDNAANLTQQSANQAAQLRANQQIAGQQNYANAAQSQAAQAATNAGLATGLAGAQTNLAGVTGNQAINQGNIAAGLQNQGAQQIQSGLGLQQGVQTANAQNQVAATGGILNAGGGAAAAMSDENLKTDIKSDRAVKSKAVANSFREGLSSDDSDSSDKPKEESSSSEQSTPKKVEHNQNRQEKASSISSSFMSDEDNKKDVKKDTMLHAFLDKLEPVTYDYKNPTGEMGMTPGKHMGIIAQDVEKASGGASMIVETPKGKAIDLASAVGMLMSAATDAHDRLSMIEDLFKARKAERKK
jgi:hypothetical protein